MRGLGSAARSDGSLTGARLLVRGLRVTLLPAPFGMGRAVTGQFPQPGPAQQVLGTAARPAAMPMDAYRRGDNFYICLDLPGIDPGSIDLTVEQNVWTVRADRAPVQADGAQMIVAERPYGTFTCQVFLGESLDADHIAADYAAGVLTLTIPVREAAKPRSIQVTSSDQKQACDQAEHGEVADPEQDAGAEPHGQGPAAPAGRRRGSRGASGKLLTCAGCSAHCAGTKQLPHRSPAAAAHSRPRRAMGAGRPGSVTVACADGGSAGTTRAPELSWEPTIRRTPAWMAARATKQGEADSGK
jgi:HSP20 family protein